MYSTVALNKQRQQHNKLARRVKLKEAHEHSKSLQFVKTYNPNANLTRMDKVVVR